MREVKNVNKNLFVFKKGEVLGNFFFFFQILLLNIGYNLDYSTYLSKVYMSLILNFKKL